MRGTRRQCSCTCTDGNHVPSRSHLGAYTAPPPELTLPYCFHGYSLTPNTSEPLFVDQAFKPQLGSFLTINIPIHYPRLTGFCVSDSSCHISPAGFDFFKFSLLWSFPRLQLSSSTQPLKKKKTLLCAGCS